MNKQPHGTWVSIPEESTLTSGPEYVALMVEWDEPMDLPIDETIAEAADEPVVEEIAEAQVTRKTLATRLDQLPVRTIAAAVGALGAIGLAAWGIHRLRAA